MDSSSAGRKDSDVISTSICTLSDQVWPPPGPGVLVMPGKPWADASSGNSSIAAASSMKQRQARAPWQANRSHHHQSRLSLVSLAMDSTQFLRKRTAAAAKAGDGRRLRLGQFFGRHRVQRPDLARWPRPAPARNPLFPPPPPARAGRPWRWTPLSTGGRCPRRCRPKRRATQANRKISPMTTARPKPACSRPAAAKERGWLRRRRGHGGQHRTGCTADACQQPGRCLGKAPQVHRFSFWMRSDGVMMSVRRMPNFSFTTTTSPWAIR